MAVAEKRWCHQRQIRTRNHYKRLIKWVCMHSLSTLLLFFICFLSFVVFFILLIDKQGLRASLRSDEAPPPLGGPCTSFLISCWGEQSRYWSLRLIKHASACAGGWRINIKGIRSTPFFFHFPSNLILSWSLRQGQAHINTRTSTWGVITVWRRGRVRYSFVWFLILFSFWIDIRCIMESREESSTNHWVEPMGTALLQICSQKVICSIQSTSWVSSSFLSFLLSFLAFVVLLTREDARVGDFEHTLSTGKDYTRHFFLLPCSAVPTNSNTFSISVQVYISYLTSPLHKIKFFYLFFFFFFFVVVERGRTSLCDSNKQFISFTW